MESSGTPGPVDPTPHVDPGAERSDRPVDPRAIDLDARRRAEANGETPGAIFSEVSDPAGAVIVTELQALNRKVDLVGTAVMAGVYLVGVLFGLAVFYYVKNGAAPLE